MQSSDAVHHYHQLKRSYAELREAVSEHDMLSGGDAHTSDAAAVTSSATNPTLMRGLLWQQRDRLFSRWKERFFVLTGDYLQCFRRGTSRMTEMGAFLFKIRLAEVSLEVVVVIRAQGVQPNKEGVEIIRLAEVRA